MPAVWREPGAGAEVTYPRLLQQFAPKALVRAKLKRVGCIAAVHSTGWFVGWW